MKLIFSAISKNVWLMALCLGLVTPALVSAAPELKVGYVDIQAVLAQSAVGKAAQKSYEQEVTSAQQDLDKKKQQLEKQKEAFDKQRDSLSVTARAQKEEELITLDKDLKRSFQDSQETLRRRNAQIVSDLVRDVREVVNAVGKEQSFTMIFERSGQGVLYADTQVDLTAQVISRFEAKKK